MRATDDIIDTIATYPAANRLFSEIVAERNRMIDTYAWRQTPEYLTKMCETCRTHLAAGVTSPVMRRVLRAELFACKRRLASLAS